MFWYFDISKSNFYKKAFRSPTFLSYNNHNFTYQMMSAMSAHCTTTVRREISNMFDTIERSNWQIPGTGTLNECGYGNWKFLSKSYKLQKEKTVYGINSVKQMAHGILVHKSLREKYYFKYPLEIQFYILN